MKKTIVFLALIAMLVSITAMSSSEKKYTEEQFIEKINTETFTQEELDELIENTEFKTIDASNVRICDGTEDDYCDVQPEVMPIGGPLKCCVEAPPRNGIK